MNDKETREAALRVFQLCRARGFTLTTAESCTGGMVAAAITTSQARRTYSTVAL